jgi:S-adenosylmethionine-dependent carboxyl methyltransferase
MRAQTNLQDKPSEPGPSAAPMEGKGFYNKHAAIPAAGGALALPLLEQAAKRIQLDAGTRPIVLADYGSSEGENSLAPMRTAIAVLRTRVDQERPIFVYHTDLPDNDFSSLFRVLHSHPDSYLRNQQNVFPSVVGRSFYQPILPPNYVDIAWSSYAAIWLSRNPCRILDHFFALRSSGDVRAEFARQAATDWEAFLSFRAAELRPSGRLVVVLPALVENKQPGFVTLLDQANVVLSDLVARKIVSTAEREHMGLAIYPRSESELLAPFCSGGHYRGLSVEDCATFPVPDTVWDEYARDKDPESLAKKRAGFFRAIFAPSLAQALGPDRHPEERLAFLAALEDGLRARMVNHPVPADNLVRIIVLAKRGSE